MTAGACGTFHASVGVNNRLSSPYQYDAAGNLVNDGSHSYTYDAENRVIQVDGGSTATYQYDAYGRRVHRAVGTAVFDYIYDAQGRIIGEIDASNSWNRVYIYTGARLTAEYLNGTTEFIHADRLGSTRLLTGLTQPATPVDNLDYLPFGEQIAGGSGTSHKFGSFERDSESNVDHTLFRQYSSQLGRWLSPDPAGLAAVDPTNPQSWNRYAYVDDDPLDFIDPLGLFLIGPCGTDGSLCDGPTFPVPGQCYNLLMDGIPIGNSCDIIGPPPILRRGGGSNSSASKKPCVPVKLLNAADPTGMGNGIYSIFRGLANLMSLMTGQTGGAGVGGGFAFGVGGPLKFAGGGGASFSAQVITDRTGDTAYSLSLSGQVPAFMQNTPPEDPRGFSGMGGAANAGLQASISSQTVAQQILQSGSGSASFSGAYGPVGVDANGSNGTLTAGAGVGSRFAFSPSFAVSGVFPVCKE